MDASLRSLVVERSAGHCEYCQIPQRFFTELFQIEHQVLSGEIVGKSAIGRTSAYVLDMNDPRRVELRAAIIALGEHA